MRADPRSSPVPATEPARLLAGGAVLALAASLTAACGAGPPDVAVGKDGVVRDSAGVTLVEHGGGGRTPDGAWRLVPERTLGAREGGAAFGRIADVDLGPDGELYVLDRQAGDVTAWASDGRLLRRFGALGGGPGEYRTPTAVRVLDDGRVAVGEAYPARLHWFGPDGAFLESVRVRPGKGGPPLLAVMADWRVTRAGVARVRLSYLSPSHADGTPVLVGALAADGTVADTLLRWTSATTPARLPTIFQAEWSWDLAGDGGLVVSPGDRYEIRYHGRDGRLRGIVRRRVPAIATSGELTDEAVTAFLERFADTDVSAATLASLRDRLDVAPFLPQVQGIHVAEPGGEVWVEVPTPGRTGEVREPGAYDVFAPSGRYLGRVAAPDGFRLHGIRDGFVHGVGTDELDVPHARTYRVARPG